MFDKLSYIHNSKLNTLYSCYLFRYGRNKHKQKDILNEIMSRQCEESFISSLKYIYKIKTQVKINQTKSRAVICEKLNTIPIG